jgi:hypothetical protein
VDHRAPQTILIQDLPLSPGKFDAPAVLPPPLAHSHSWTHLACVALASLLLLALGLGLRWVSLDSDVTTTKTSG